MEQDLSFSYKIFLDSKVYILNSNSSNFFQQKKSNDKFAYKIVCPYWHQGNLKLRGT